MPERKENLPYDQKLFPRPEKMLKELVREEIGWETIVEELKRLEKENEVPRLLRLMADAAAILPEEFAKSKDALLAPDQLEKIANLILDEKESSQYDFAMYDAACFKRIAPELFDRLLGDDFLIDRYQALSDWLKAERGYQEKYIFDIANLKTANPWLFEFIVKPNSQEWRDAWRNHALAIVRTPHAVWEEAMLLAALNSVRPQNISEIVIDPDIAKQFVDVINALVNESHYAEALQIIADVRQLKIAATATKSQTIH